MKKFIEKFMKPIVKTENKIDFKKYGKGERNFAGSKVGSPKKRKY